MKNNILYQLLTLVFVLMFSFAGCKKKEVPVLETISVINITASSAKCGGNITGDGGETVISRGVCWSTGIKPSIADSKTTDGAGAGTFSSLLTDLRPATDYFIRAYATSSSGTGYGMVMSFKTLGESPVSATLTATNIGTSSARLSGTVNPNYLSTSVSFEYGSTITYGQSSVAPMSPVTGNTTINIYTDLQGLTPGTTYHYRIKSENSLGIAFGADMIFTTLGQAPAAYTQDATSINATSATLKGYLNANFLPTTVTFEYGTSTSYGSIINASPNIVTGGTLFNVTAPVSGLTPGTTYHFRIKAVNSLGTTYGNDFTFVPSGPIPVTDVDGNSYATIVIGSQTWMSENLRTTKYNDNTDIPPVTDNNNWKALLTPGYCWYNNDQDSYKNTYGGIYNWYAVNTGKLCPAGWHVPSDAEFITLTDFLGGAGVAGGKMKEAGTNNWSSPNTGATNETGFTALPGGQRDESAAFIGAGLNGVWWTSTPYNSIKPWYRSLSYNVSSVFSGNGSLNIRGFSIRCVKN